MAILRPTRPLAAAIALWALAIAAASIGGMTHRVVAFYERTTRTLYAFQPVNERRFTYADRPVSLTDHADPRGSVVVVLRYADDEVRIPAALPPRSEQLPGLLRHADWLRILRFAPIGRETARDLERRLHREGGDRLAIVVRRPVLGPHRVSGAISPRDWNFEFYELLPGGGIRTERLAFPTSRPGRAAKPDQIQENTWQHDAALLIIPETARPKRSFTTDAVRAMGWTLPAAAFSLLVCFISLGIAYAPRRAAFD